MNAYELPEFLNQGPTGDLYIHHYRSDKSYLKNRIILNQNLICILLNGTKEVFGPQQSIKIDNTEIFLMSSGNAVMWESISDGNKLESLLIFFSNAVLREFFVRHDLHVSGSVNKSQAVISMKKDDYLLSFQQSLKALASENLSAIQRIKVEELLVYLGLTNHSESFHSFVNNALGSAEQSKLRDVVEANAYKSLGIEELAFLCNMSSSTFKRHFERTFKCSPGKYFTNKRMEKAKEMLLLDKRPSEIYAELRYQNLSSFSTEFKKYFGVSPKYIGTR